MYDAFSSDYDRFVNWPARLSYEMPFIEQQLMQVSHSPLHILDAACGTGMHAISLAQLGHQVAGADLSPAMIERARRNAAAQSTDVRFEAAGFGELAARFGNCQFDALLCLGNSLPHLLSLPEMRNSLADFAAVLRPGGLLLVQNRNFDAVLERRERWMEPQSHQEGDNEWLFLRAYDFDPDNLITFHVLTLRRSAGGNWTQRVVSTRLRPILQAELDQALSETGFTSQSFFGDMTGSSFNPHSSGNLISIAIRT